MAKDTDDRKTEDQDGGHSLDMSQAAVKRMIAEARERGYITYDQLNAVLPPEQVSSEQIEDVMAMLSEMGINIIDNDEAEEAAEGSEDGAEEGPANEVMAPSSTSREVAVAQTETEKLDRTDDPVRMYLREMGSVELLSREGEIAIAKRIEAGRATMIAGLCESPLTFQAITIWRDELLSEDILLRDVIDLEATFGNQLDEDASPDEPVVSRPRGPPRPRARTSPSSTPTATRSCATTRTTTTTRPACRSPRWRPRSSPTCSPRSTASPPTTRGCRRCRICASARRSRNTAATAPPRRPSTRRCAPRSWRSSTSCTCTTTASRR